MLNAIPEKTSRKKKDHNKINTQAFIAAKVSNKDRQERKRLARIAGKAKATSKDITKEDDDDGIYT